RGGAQADPLAAAQDARAPRGGLRLGGDGQTDGAAELDAVRALVQVDEHGQRMRGAALLPGRPRDLLRRLLRDLALQRSARQADGRAQLDQIAGHEATAEDALRSRQVGDARGDLPPVKVSTMESEAWRLVSSARMTPSSVLSSSVRMKLPSRLRISC